MVDIFVSSYFDLYDSEFNISDQGVSHVHVF